MKDYQKILFPYAYNILGSSEDAKDTIQEVMSRYMVLSKSTQIENESGYLIRSVINRSINVRKQRKKIISDRVFLPEPVSTESSDTDLYLNDIVSYSMLILMDQLNEKERAVFILKEAFNYSHEEIAEVLSYTIENSRKLLSRAKKKLNKTSKPAQLRIEKDVRIQVEKYIRAIRERDIRSLEKMFARDIVVVADGGEKVNVVRNLTTGIIESIQLMIHVYEKFQQGQTLRFVQMNHQPAVLYSTDGRLETCQIFTFDDDHKILGICNIVDPDKLRKIEVV